MPTPQTDSLIVQLVSTIEAEIRLFQELLDTLGAEQQALLRHEPQALETAVEEQQRLTRAGTELEAQRVALVERLSTEMDEESASLTLKRLIARVSGPHADQLSEMRETLLDLQERIQRANRHNAMLINQSMKYVDKSLQLLTGMGNSTGAYGASGKSSTPGGTGQAVVDRMA